MSRPATSAAQRLMLLIDADNVSIDLIEQAVQRILAEYGALHVRRAYCDAETAVKHQASFKRLSIRPQVNLAAGKNSTDIALAVDAMDLVISERPDIVVIASSDSDFAPLVLRLREKGCRVLGIGQEGKVGAETQQVYDAYLVLTHRGHESTAARRPARRTRKAEAAAEAAPPPPVPSPAPPPPAAARPAPASSTARPARPTRRGASRAGREGAAAHTDLTRSILAAIPELHRGQTVELRLASARLRDAGLLGARGSSTRFFAPLADAFELLPADQPNRLRWRGSHGP